MKIADIKKVDPSKLKNPKLKEFYETLSKGTDNFNPDFIELYEEQIITYLEKVKEFEPEALETKPVKKRTPKPPKEKPIDFEDEDVVDTVMEDYNLTREKAIKLIALRKEAYELKKENLDKLLNRLDETEFYKGKLSNSPIDKGRSRDLGKDSKQGSITLAEERKMTKTPFKRISKAGRKNQYGTTEGGNVYYEYRQNRRDVDNKIQLAHGGRIDKNELEKLKNLAYQLQSADDSWISKNHSKFVEMQNEYKKQFRKVYGHTNYEDPNNYSKGGGVEIPNAEKMFHLPYELAVYVPSTKDVDKNISATELRARVKEVEKYLAETFGGFTSAEKVGGYLSSKSSIVTEKVIPVTAFATRDSFRSNKSKLINKMSVWAKIWGQEAIGFEFEGDLYYVPQKFKKGGKLTATYIPKSDIKTLTTIYGNNIKGKDLIDGAYTTRKDIKNSPKMVRTLFEEEEFSDFGKGGRTKKPKTVRYYFEDEAYEYAKGGATEHGLKVGDEILEIGKNLVFVLPKGESKDSSVLNYDIVNISNGSRINGLDYYSMKSADQRKWAK